MILLAKKDRYDDREYTNAAPATFIIYANRV
jgi:hypothetical protein